MTTIGRQADRELGKNEWFRLGLAAAAAAVLAVIAVQALALSVWPELARFKPLDNYARTALFTVVPAAGATAVFARLVSRRPQPVRAFMRIAAAVLLVSIFPDYLLPLPNKTFLGSTVAALLHLVAAAVIVLVLVVGYRRQAG